MKRGRVRRTPGILHQGWRFLGRERFPGGGSVVLHVSLADPRLERRRHRPAGYVRSIDVYSFDGQPCFSPAEAASRAALAALEPRPVRFPPPRYRGRPVQLELLP